MKTIKNAFIHLAISNHALQFGTFTLKSGRISPYFFNTGLFYTGSALMELGDLFAKTLIHYNIDTSRLFGPAYKGFTLATATSIALAKYGKKSSLSFNRKEPKDHGEQGSIIGAPLQGNIVMIDDVITAGTAFRETKTLIQAAGATLSTVMIALDRCERGHSQQSTLTDIQQEGINVVTIIDFFDLLHYLKEENDQVNLEKLTLYHQQYGCPSFKENNPCT